MVIIHLLLFFLFILVGIFGLIFQVDEGVLIGLALAPWQLRVILSAYGKRKSGLLKVMILVAGVVGFGYFLLQSNWVWGLALLAFEGFLYLLVVKTDQFIANQESAKEEKQ